MSTTITRRGQPILIHPAISARELGTILAALRLYQRTPCVPSAITQIAAFGGTDPLGVREIDRLCERLCCA